MTTPNVTESDSSYPSSADRRGSTATTLRDFAARALGVEVIDLSAWQRDLIDRVLAAGPDVRVVIDRPRQSWSGVLR